MSFKKSPKLPSGLKTYALPGETEKKLGVEASCDLRAFELFEKAFRAGCEDQDMTIRLLQAAVTLAMIGLKQEDILKYIEEGAVQAAQSLLLTRAGVSAQEFAQDPQTSADKLAQMMIKGLEAAGKSTQGAN
jgi:hypothetical protein